MGTKGLFVVSLLFFTGVKASMDSATSESYQVVAPDTGGSDIMQDGGATDASGRAFVQASQQDGDGETGSEESPDGGPVPGTTGADEDDADLDTFLEDRLTQMESEKHVDIDDIVEKDTVAVVPQD